MKFNHLKINGFGKLVQKEIELSPGINVIYGENESGKSSLLKCLTAMLYGLAKTKNGKSIPDIERYKPWKTEEFSASLKYTLDNGENFEVFREFKKKNPNVYNNEKEDISKTFKENKTKGIAFFEEQTGIEEETYLNTAIIEQEGVKLTQTSQNSIIQKISNKVSSGDDNVSYKKTLSQITKLQGEKVGTDRTQNRPINIVNAEIKKLENKRRELEEIKENILNNNKDFETLIVKLENLENGINLINALKELKDKYKLDYAEIDFNTKIANENNEKIKKLKEKLDALKDENEVETKKPISLYIIGAILVLISILLLVFVTNKVFGAIALIIGILDFVYIMLKNKKETQKIKEQESKSQDEILNEINVLKKSTEEKNNEINAKLDKINEEVDYQKEKIYYDFKDIVDINYMEKVFDYTEEELVKSANTTEKDIEKTKHDIHEIEFSRNSYNKQLNELPNIVEKLEILYEEQKELMQLNNSYNIAKECLEKAYEEVKKNISPKFTANLCNIISKISDNKYNNVNVSDDEGLVVQIDNGNYVPAERLSVGTIDQMYLSLRLSSLQEISTEKMPIILDEVFAYFDNQRLNNILNYLAKEYKDNQILIFTCSKREEEALKNLNIDFKLLYI